MTLTEAVATLDRTPLRWYSIRMEVDKGAGAKWLCWDGFNWHAGATLGQAVGAMLASHNLGADGTLREAERALAG